MAGKDYYAILGIARSASDKEIKQAYRRLARRYHPDVNPGDKTAEARFKEINQAYEVISDPEKRRKYDQFGENWQYGEQFARAGQSRPRESGPVFQQDFGDMGGPEILFEQIFQNMGRGRASHRRMPAEQPVEITLEEAFQGTSRILEDPGQRGQPRRLEVKIPPGVTTGSRVRIPTEGRHGDIYLVVTVRPHPLFQRQGNDLSVEVQLSLATAMLGGEVAVPTLKGQVMLKVPPETQNGRVFRLAGLGMPHLGDSSRGDLYARVKVVLPTKLSPREKELFQHMRSLRP